MKERMILSISKYGQKDTEITILDSLYNDFDDKYVYDIIEQIEMKLNGTVNQLIVGENYVISKYIMCDDGLNYLDKDIKFIKMSKSVLIIEDL